MIGERNSVLSALEMLPDNAVRELQQYNVICESDEALVGLMVSAGGINYDETARDVAVCEMHGEPILFASPRLPWRMKAVTHREKNAGDLFFLRLTKRGEVPPQI